MREWRTYGSVGALGRQRPGATRSQARRQFGWARVGGGERAQDAKSCAAVQLAQLAYLHQIREGTTVVVIAGKSSRYVGTIGANG